MDELTSIRMQNLQAVVAGVRDAFDADHVLHVLNATTGDDGDVNVRDVRKSLKDVFGLLRKRGQVGMGRDGSQSSIVVEQKRQLVRVPDVPEKVAQLNQNI